MKGTSTATCLVQCTPTKIQGKIAQKCSQKFKVMKFENLEREYVVDFLVTKYLVDFSRKTGMKFVTETSPHSSDRSSQEAKRCVTTCTLLGQSHVRKTKKEHPDFAHNSREKRKRDSRMRRGIVNWLQCKRSPEPAWNCWQGGPEITENEKWNLRQPVLWGRVWWERVWGLKLMGAHH